MLALGGAGAGGWGLASGSPALRVAAKWRLPTVSMALGVVERVSVFFDPDGDDRYCLRVGFSASGASFNTRSVDFSRTSFDSYKNLRRHFVAKVLVGQR